MYHSHAAGWHFVSLFQVFFAVHPKQFARWTNCDSAAWMWHLRFHLLHERKLWEQQKLTNSFFHYSLCFKRLGRRMWSWRAEQMFQVTSSPKVSNWAWFCTERRISWIMPWSRGWLKMHPKLHTSLYDTSPAPAVHENLPRNGQRYSGLVSRGKLSNWVPKTCKMFRNGQAAA